MARVGNNAMDSLRRWHHRQDHPIWFSSFSEQEQKRLVEEDLSAGYSVTLLLVAVIILGFVLVGTTVLLTVI
jgi:hypothetical protein